MRGLAKTRVDERAIARVLRRVELESGAAGPSVGCVEGISVVPGTADVNDSWSFAAAVTSS